MMIKTYFTLLFSLYLFGHASLMAQVAVEPSVASSAQAAVKELGVQMMKGNFQYGYQNIYPRWKRRLAARYGGMKELENQMANAANQKTEMQFTVTGFQAHLPTSFFSVWKAKKIDDATGLVVKDAMGREVITENWLAIVPTTTRVKLPDPGKAGLLREVEENGYTIVISEKGSNKWFFMTGLKPTVQDLRSLFPSLPPTKEGLGLPESSARIIN